MNISAFGLDIGTTSLKSVWFERKKQGMILKSVYTSQVPENGMISSSPIDEQNMAQAIHQHVQEGKIGTRSVNIALPDNQVYTKVLDLPVLTDKELDAAITWEAEQYIPAPLPTIMLDRIILRTNIQTTSGPKMQVLLVGAPKALIEKYQRVIEIAGLSVESIENETLAALRAIVTSATFPTSLIVCVGHNNTSYAIVQNGILVFAYTIPLGSSTMTRAIASSFGFSMQQADEYKKTYGISDQQVGEKIYKSIEPILNSILSEAKKALAYYNSRYKGDAAVSQIVLSGGTAKLPGIDVLFVKQTGIETVVANPWRSLAVSQLPQAYIDLGPEFVVAIGLSLKENE